MGLDRLSVAHVPTGPVMLEAVLRLAIQELGVRPARTDWLAVLDATQVTFIENSS